MTKYKTLIVFPCYNESKRLKLSLFKSVLAKTEDLYFLFVNDGSKDNTLEILNNFKLEFPAKVYVHTYEQNQGKAYAVQQGINYALKAVNPDLIGYWDADLAVSLSEIERFKAEFDKATQLQALLAARVKMLGYKIIRNPLRHYVGRIFATAASLLLHLPVYDTQCGAKLFRRECAQEVFNKPFISKWIFDVEVILRIKNWLNKKYSEKEIENYINEIPVFGWQEVAGSKIKLKHYLTALLDFIKLFFLAKK